MVTMRLLRFLGRRTRGIETGHRRQGLDAAHARQRQALRAQRRRRPRLRRGGRPETKLTRGQESLWPPWSTNSTTGPGRRHPGPIPCVVGPSCRLAVASPAASEASRPVRTAGTSQHSFQPKYRRRGSASPTPAPRPGESIQARFAARVSTLPQQPIVLRMGADPHPLHTTVVPLPSDGPVVVSHPH